MGCLGGLGGAFLSPLSRQQDAGLPRQLTSEQAMLAQWLAAQEFVFAQQRQAAILAQMKKKDLDAGTIDVEWTEVEPAKLLTDGK